MAADPYAEFADAPAAAAPAADPYAEFADAPAAPSAPTLDAAEFQRRVGRVPSAPELANFQATPQNWANDPNAITAPGTNAVNDAGTGFGIGINSSEMGVHQIALHIGQHLGLVKPQDVADFDNKVAQQKQADAPTLNTTAGVVGNTAEKIGEFAVGGAALKGSAALGFEGVPLVKAGLESASPWVRAGTGIAADAATGAAQGAAQPVVGDESRLTNAEVGGAGGAAGAAVGKVISPALGAGAKALKAAGVPLTAAQEGSPLGKVLQTIKSYIPFGDESDTPQLKGFTRGVLKTIGETSDTADPETMAAAQKRIGGAMDDVTSRNNVTFDNPLQDDLARIQNTGGELLGNDTEAGRTLNRQIGNVMNKVEQDGTISGPAFQQLRTNAGLLSDDSNGTLRMLGGQLTKALDESFGRSVAPEDATAWQTARQQYGRMQTIKKAIGDNDLISPHALAQKIDTVDNTGLTVFGKGDQTLWNLAKNGKQVLTTSKHSDMSKLITGAVLMGGGGEEGMRLRDKDGKFNTDAAIKGAGALALGRWVLPAVLRNPGMFRAAGAAAAPVVGGATNSGRAVTASGGQGEPQ
jgi:hypothetical protein